MDKRPRVRDCRTPSLQRARWMLEGKMQSIWLGVCSASLLIIRKHHEMPEILSSELQFGGFDAVSWPLRHARNVCIQQATLQDSTGVVQLLWCRCSGEALGRSSGNVCVQMDNFPQASCLLFLSFAHSFEVPMGICAGIEVLQVLNRLAAGSV